MYLHKPFSPSEKGNAKTIIKVENDFMCKSMLLSIHALSLVTEYKVKQANWGTIFGIPLRGYEPMFSNTLRDRPLSRNNRNLIYNYLLFLLVMLKNIYHKSQMIMIINHAFVCWLKHMCRLAIEHKQSCPSDWQLNLPTMAYILFEECPRFR